MAIDDVISLSDSQHHSLIAMMISIQRRLENVAKRDAEYDFLTHSVRYLSTSSGRQVPVENWMITSLDVEFGPEIGSGG